VDDNLVSKKTRDTCRIVGRMLYANSASGSNEDQLSLLYNWQENCKYLLQWSGLALLGLTNPLQGDNGGEVEVDVRSLSETTEEVAKQLWTAVGSSCRYSVLRENIGATKVALELLRGKLCHK